MVIIVSSFDASRCVLCCANKVWRRFWMTRHDAKLEEKTHNAILSSLLDRIMREIFRLLVCSFGVLNMCLCILWHRVVLPLS
jgi:hypothetical protein